MIDGLDEPKVAKEWEPIYPKIEQKADDIGELFGDFFEELPAISWVTLFAFMVAFGLAMMALFAKPFAELCFIKIFVGVILCNVGLAVACVAAYLIFAMLIPYLIDEIMTAGPKIKRIMEKR